VAAEAGADGITAHLREDRRHITDTDIARLAAEIALPLNLEMAATEEMLGIALRHRPHAACIVPERRAERTTEGGLDAAGMLAHLGPMVARLSEAGVRVSLFIEPDQRQIDAALALGAPVIELHTGAYAHSAGSWRATELARIERAARDATLITRPRTPRATMSCTRICRIAMYARSTAPKRLTSNVRFQPARHAAKSSPSKRFSAKMPALLTSVSMRPKRAIVWATSGAWAAGSPTSLCAHATLAPPSSSTSACAAAAAFA